MSGAYEFTIFDELVDRLSDDSFVGWFKSARCFGSLVLPSVLEVDSHLLIVGDSGEAFIAENFTKFIQKLKNAGDELCTAL